MGLFSLSHDQLLMSQRPTHPLHPHPHVQVGGPLFPWVRPLTEQTLDSAGISQDWAEQSEDHQWPQSLDMPFADDTEQPPPCSPAQEPPGILNPD